MCPEFNVALDKENNSSKTKENFIRLSSEYRERGIFIFEGGQYRINTQKLYGRAGESILTSEEGNTEGFKTFYLDQAEGKWGFYIWNNIEKSGGIHLEDRSRVHSTKLSVVKEKDSYMLMIQDENRRDFSFYDFQESALEGEVYMFGRMDEVDFFEDEDVYEKARRELERGLGYCIKDFSVKFNPRGSVGEDKEGYIDQGALVLDVELV